MNWQKIDENPPKLNMPVLVCNSRDVATASLSAGFRVYGGKDIPIFHVHPQIWDKEWDGLVELEFTPTHWADLPDPPDESNT